MSAFLLGPRYLSPLRTCCECTEKWLKRAREWDIIYGGYLHNHITHNLVVMGCIGSPEEVANARMEWWYNLYATHSSSDNCKLQAARIQTDDMELVHENNWRSLIGFDSCHYPSFLKYFDDQFKTSDVVSVVQHHLPHLLPGMAGSALHPIIHFGLSIEVKSTSMMAEGLACLCCFYQPLESDDDKLWNDAYRCHSLIDKSIDFLQRANEDDMHGVVASASNSECYMQLNIGAFQRKIRTFNDKQYPMRETLNRAGTVALPDVGLSLEPAIVEATTFITAAYLASECEFFVIHCLTSLHGLLAAMPYLDEWQQRQALSLWWRATMATLVAQNIPKFEVLIKLLNEWKQLDLLNEERVTTNRVIDCNDSHTEGVKDNMWWTQQLDVALTSTDEHASKAVYVLWRWSEMNFVPSHSKELFERAVLVQTRPVLGGGPERNIWFSF